MLDARALQLGDEPGELAKRHRLIRAAMLDQQARLGLLVVLAGRRLQPAVHAHHPLEIGAAAGQLQHRRPAEAVTERHSVIEPPAQLARLRQRPRQQLAHPRPVLIERPGELLLLFHGRRPHSDPVQVHRKHAVPERRQHLGPLDLIVRQTVPVMHQQHQRRLGAGGQVVALE
ncbi:hypothetical protein D3C86_1745190 [compost metagenome]